MDHLDQDELKRLAPARRKLALAMRREGLTYEAIGQALGVSAPRAWQLVKRAQQLESKE
jgi:DNA-directed RNA polymerase specialized sigma24 family protein